MPRATTGPELAEVEAEMVSITVRIPRGLKERAEQRAKDNDEPFARLLRRALTTETSKRPSRG